MFDYLTIWPRQISQISNKSYHLRSLYSCIFYYNIKTVTFMGFDIPIPNFINSTIDIYDFPEKIMGNGINERMLYLCLLRLPSKESSNILINVSSTNSRLRGLKARHLMRALKKSHNSLNCRNDHKLDAEIVAHVSFF